jgi:hypothetical protein
MRTLGQFIKDNRIKVSCCEMVGENPNCPDWTDAYHYKVTLSSRVESSRRQMTVYFSMGYAHNNEPTAADILDCLASDAASVDNARSFEEWAADYGYDTDSRKAEKIFRACEAQAAKLSAFLGDEYSNLLYETERM